MVYWIALLRGGGAGDLTGFRGRSQSHHEIRKEGAFVQSQKKMSFSASKGYGSPVKKGISSLLFRVFSQYRKAHVSGKNYLGRNKLFGSLHPCYGSKSISVSSSRCSYQSYHSRKFCTISGSGSLVHPLFVWKRLKINGDGVIPVISKLACAVSLSFTRFHVVPGILALAAGKLSRAHRVYADSGHMLPINGFVTGAEASRLLVSSAFHSIVEGILLICRAAYLTFVMVPVIVMAPFVDSFGMEFRKSWIRLVHRTLERAGPAFIKWGQWAATRPDLFPQDLCMELTKLHTKAPAHSFAYSKLTVEKAFGRKLHEIFENFEETPVASGSIAQVHRASLKFRYAGQRLNKPIEVAVKVRHPGVGNAIRRDFAIINFIAKVSTYIPGLKWLRLDESVRQFAVFMMTQVDLSREAAHLSRFIYNFRRWKDVSFPRPLYPLVHPSVLVETFEKGDCVSRYIDELEGNTRIKRDLAHIGTHAFLKMLLVDNFIHADMHPGNILVRLPQMKRSRKKIFRPKPHVVFLDVGMTAELSKTDRANLLEFFKAVALRDGRTAAECTLRLSQKQSCPNPQAFIQELETTFSFWGTPEGDIFHPVECMHQLLEQVRRHKVNVDGNVCTVLVTILVLESWQRKLDPDFDIMYTLKTLLLKEDWAQPIDYFFS